MASCENQPQPVKMPVSGSLHTENTVADRLFQQVNAYRRSHGANELQRHAGLDRLAQNHCEYLRQHRGNFGLYGNNVSHMGFDGRFAIVRERYNMSNLSENVAAANHASLAPVPSLMNLFKSSAEHHKTMLDDWSHTGVGVVVDADGTVFATQLFSTVSFSQLTMRNRFSHF